jgi:hypothetical protein
MRDRGDKSATVAIQREENQRNPMTILTIFITGALHLLLEIVSAGSKF